MKSSRTLQALSQDRLKASQNENAALNYSVNWGAQIDTATISTSTWTSEDNVTIASESNTTTTASAILSGGVGTYRVVNKITTSDGQTDERIFLITIRENDDYLRDYG